jgi:50S ribosomal protein L16 3-hydroxylase
MALNNFDVQDFLTNYWQKKPMVIRKAFDEPFWLEPGDLAGLACEEDIEARIIMQTEDQWPVECGPFEEQRFASLPEKNWTLLVQAVDQWIPEVRDILNDFDFLPSWRLDDLMVSYAPVGGTVSQHYDFFDVFLIQGEGSRKWQIGQVCGSHSELLPDTSVRILKEFDVKMEVVLEPGDILYIPAKHAHLGVSVEDSLTYSVGFRAPSIRDIVDGVATSALEGLLEDQRYQDSLASLQASKGKIPKEAISQLQKMITEALANESLVSSWLGEYVTERKYPDLELLSDGEPQWKEYLDQGAEIERNAASRFAYIGAEVGCSLFVDGVSYTCSKALASELADQNEICSKRVVTLLNNQQDEAVISDLFESGALLLSE